MKSKKFHLKLVQKLFTNRFFLWYHPLICQNREIKIMYRAEGEEKQILRKFYLVHEIEHDS